MSKIVVFSPDAPAPIGPYSQAILMHNTLYVSGQIAIHQADGSLHTQDIESETRQVMKNLQHILTAAKMDFTHVVKCTIFLTNMDNFAKVNAIYGEYFPAEPPARETVEVSRLPKNVNVEISCVAVRSSV